MERSEILTTMAELKLYGMKAAFDQIVTAAAKRQHEPQQVIGDFSRTQSRSGSATAQAGRTRVENDGAARKAIMTCSPLPLCAPRWSTSM